MTIIEVAGISLATTLILAALIVAAIRVAWWVVRRERDQAAGTTAGSAELADEFSFGDCRCPCSGCSGCVGQ